MNRNLSFWISRRISGKKSVAGKTGNIIAVLGVMFAVAVMEITVAVSVGFKNEIFQKLEGFISPVTITSLSRLEDSDQLTNLTKFDEETVRIIRENAPGTSVKESLVVQGILKTVDDFSVVALKGYKSDYEADFEKSNLKFGRWIEPTDRRALVLSQNVANQLKLSLGDRVDLCYFVNDNVKSRPFEIVGIYDSGFEEYDKIIAYTDFEILRNIYHADSCQVSMIELKNIPLQDVDEVDRRISSELNLKSIIDDQGNTTYSVSTITRQGAQYLNWLELLDTNVVVIFILMALVALCALISSLFIQVLEKINFIGVFKAIGASNAMVSKVFVHLSVRLVVKGMILGNLLGLGIILLQKYTHFLTLDAEMYYLKYVPVEINVPDILLLNLGVLITAWLILYLPARSATRTSPARTLRFD